MNDVGLKRRDKDDAVITLSLCGRNCNKRKAFSTMARQSSKMNALLQYDHCAASRESMSEGESFRQASPIKCCLNGVQWLPCRLKAIEDGNGKYTVP